MPHVGKVGQYALSSNDIRPLSLLHLSAIDEIIDKHASCVVLSDVQVGVFGKRIQTLMKHIMTLFESCNGCGSICDIFPFFIYICPCCTLYIY